MTFLIRACFTAGLIYWAVWLENKFALTALFVFIAAASEISAWRLQTLSEAIAGTIGAAAARIKAREQHRRWHGDRS